MVHSCQEFKEIEEYFLNQGYTHIAIYGMGDVGKILLNELDGGNIQIAYVVDKSEVSLGDRVRLIKPNQSFDKVDLIVVTAIGDFENICRMISQKVQCPILSIEDIVFEYGKDYYSERCL